MIIMSVKKEGSVGWFESYNLEWFNWENSVEVRFVKWIGIN